MRATVRHYGTVRSYAIQCNSSATSTSKIRLTLVNICCAREDMSLLVICGLKKIFHLIGASLCVLFYQGQLWCFHGKGQKCAVVWC